VSAAGANQSDRFVSDLGKRLFQRLLNCCHSVGLDLKAMKARAVVFNRQSDSLHSLWPNSIGNHFTIASVSLAGGCVVLSHEITRAKCGVTKTTKPRASLHKALQ